MPRNKRKNEHTTSLKMNFELRDMIQARAEEWDITFAEALRDLILLGLKRYVPNSQINMTDALAAQQDALRSLRLALKNQQQTDEKAA